MRSDTELLIRGMDILKKNLGPIELEKFISLIKRESEDYTKWRKKLINELENYTLEELNDIALQEANNLKK